MEDCSIILPACEDPGAARNRHDSGNRKKRAKSKTKIRSDDCPRNVVVGCEQASAN